MEKLALTPRASFEVQVNELVHQVLAPLGYRVEVRGGAGPQSTCAAARSWPTWGEGGAQALSRAPYLCEGDMYRRWYSLDDIVLVLSVLDPEP